MFVNIPLITNLAESEQLSWDMAKQIIQSQHTLAIYGITAVVAVAAGLMLASWIWNVFLRRHELQRAMESLRSEITTKVEEDFAILSERTKDEIGKMENRVEKTIEERMTRFDKTAEERMILFDAEKARLFALVNGQMGQWENAVEWEAIAIKKYAKTEKENLLRIMVIGLNHDLEKCKELTDNVKEDIKKCLLCIPEVLTIEKKQIENKLKLNRLPEETKEH